MAPSAGVWGATPPLRGPIDYSEHIDPRPPSRLILVSNRLPVSARVERGELIVAQGAGGLVTGLSGLHARGKTLWIGWPGETWRLSPEQRADLDGRLAEAHCVPVELTAGEIERYYEGFSNGVLWPLLHYELERLPMHPSGWESYREVNERFADAVVEQYRPGDRIWVHDYQLMLVPGLRPSPAAGRGDRLLPARPVPHVGALPGSPVAARPAGRAARGFPGRVSHGVLRRALHQLRIQDPRLRDRPRPGQDRWSPRAGRRLPDGHRRGGVRGARRRPCRADGDGPGAARRGRHAAHRGRGPARLHEGHPQAAADVRAAPGALSQPPRQGPPGPGGGALARVRRRVPRVPPLGRGAGRPPERPVRDGRLRPDQLHLSDAAPRAAGGALPRRRPWRSSRRCGTA